MSRVPSFVFAEAAAVDPMSIPPFLCFLKMTIPQGSQIVKPAFGGLDNYFRVLKGDRAHKAHEKARNDKPLRAFFFFVLHINRLPMRIR